MTWFGKKTLLWDLFLMTLGSGCLAFGIQWLYSPIGLVTGGFSGIAIIAQQYGIPLWLTNFALNIPVFFVAWKVKGKKFVGRTGFAASMLSVWLYFLPEIDLSQQDPMLAAIFGGVLSGAGIGFVLLAKSTTGGTDLLAVLLQHKIFRHYSVVQILQVIDGLIVIAGLYMFGIRIGFYAVIAIFVTSKISDTLMEGMKFSKAALIVTGKSEQMAKVLERLNRGVTGLYAKGMYSGSEKCLLYCVVSKKEIVDLKEIVAEIDPSAFVIVSDAREVLGEGFLEYKK